MRLGNMRSMALTLLAALTGGCTTEVTIVGDGAASEPPDCEAVIDGRCIGAAGSDTQVAGPCACDGEPRAVAGLEELASAITAGGCLQLANGDYGSVELPAGIQLVGESMAGVVLNRLALSDGGSACMLSVKGSGLSVSGSASLKYVLVEGSSQDGVTVAPGASLSMSSSTVRDSGRYHMSAFDVASIRLERVLIEHHGYGGPGLWLQCSDGCECARPPVAELSYVAIRSVAVVAVSLVGANANLTSVYLEHTNVGDDFQAGGGLAVSACSNVEARDLRLIGNADFGMIVDDSGFAADGLVAEDNLRGVWLQNAALSRSHRMSLRNATISDNEGVGLGIKEPGSYEISDSSIQRTVGITLPCLIGGVSAGSHRSADGVSWSGGATGVFRRVTIGASDRSPMVIEGAAEGLLEDVVLTDGDEQKGIAQVFYDGGPQPEVLGSTAAIQTFAESPFEGHPCPPGPSP